MIAMKIKRFAAACIVFLGLWSCSEDKVDSPNPKAFFTPEEALLNVLKDEERDLIIMGSSQLRNGSVLTVFKGYMNDQDIWMADISHINDLWKVDHLDLLKGLGAADEEKGLIYTNEKTGYEVGFLTAGNSDIHTKENMKMIDTGEGSFWIKDLGIHSQ
jgi:hypothetical protein